MTIVESANLRTRILDNRKWDILINRIETLHCTPFIGPEACFGSFPPASEIARELAAEYGYPLEDVENLPRVAQFCFNRDGGDTLVKEKVARKLMSVEPPDFRDPSEPHLALASLPFPIYINTHYHGFCSRALQAQHKDPRRAVCRWYQDDCDKDPDRATFKGYLPNPANPLVFNLYGHIAEPDSLVLTEDDYLDFLVKIARSGNRLIPGPVQDALTNSSLLFLGFPTSEIGFRALLRYLACNNQLRRPQRKANVLVQVITVGSAITEEQLAQTKSFLGTYYEQLDVAVFWGSSREFVKELNQRWLNYEEKKHGR